MMKNSIFVLILISFVFCKNTDKKNTEIKEEVNVSEKVEPNMSYGMNYDRYSLGNYYYYVFCAYDVYVDNGPDFSIHSLYSSRDSIYFYTGLYPSLPPPLKFYSKDYSVMQREELVNKAKDNDGYYTFNSFEIINEEYENDKQVLLEMDSVVIELFLIDSVPLWIRKPFKDKSGGIDIYYSLNENSMNKLHFWAKQKEGETRTYDNMLSMVKSFYFSKH